ncbi:MAG: hypothetical protein NZ805_10270 [Armatimonadetes bacterium]|nr:hypothetical protein [Armatimonadota bacterium]MDW8028872.1 hypothetical protein [Armatimonadota bacterium]
MLGRPTVDIGFLNRTYKTTLAVGGLVTLLLCSTANSMWVLNYAIGVLTMLAFVKTTEIFVTQTYRAPSEVKPKRHWIGAMMLGKWLILALGLYLLNRMRYFDGVFLLAGLVTFHAVIIFKVFGLMLQSQMQDRRVKTVNSKQKSKGGLD